MSLTDFPTVMLTAGAAIARFLRVKLSAGKLVVAGLADKDIGCIEAAASAEGDIRPVRLHNCPGTCTMIANGVFAAEVEVYTAAAGKISSVKGAGARVVGVAMTASTGDGVEVEVLRGAYSETQDDLTAYPVKVMDLAVWDAPTTRAVVATAAADDLAVVYNTFLTAGPTVESGDLKNTTTTRKVGFQFAVPAEYNAGETIKLRVNAGMKTTVASASCTLDAEVARQAAPTVDICATAAASINSLVAANIDFTITPTNVVPGDLLDVVLTIVVTDSATATAVIGKINTIQMLIDVRH